MILCVRALSTKHDLGLIPGGSLVPANWPLTTVMCQPSKNKENIRNYISGNINNLKIICPKYMKQNLTG